MTASISCARISVAMAAYNGEKYIQEQLDSIARQDLPPLELVVTDDGSSDATLEILKAFARGAPFEVRIFRNETRLGYADNFLKAASLCRGDLIAFCDQDDIWMEQKLRTCAGFFDDPEVLLVAHSARTLLDSGERGHLFPRFKNTRVSSSGASNPFSFVHGFAMVATRELLRLARVTPRPARLAGHDQWVWFLAASTGKIATVMDVLALYRQHQDNAFGAQPRTTMSSTVRGALQAVDYGIAAEFECACSAILLALAEQYPERADRFNLAGRKIGCMSRLHRVRHQIYSNDSNLFRRAGAFLHILAQAGYLPDAFGARLGPRAAIKDLFFGVPRIQKLRAPANITLQKH